MSREASEAYEGARDLDLINFDDRGLRASISARFGVGFEQEASNEADGSIKTEQISEDIQKLAQSILQFWDQYEEITSKFNHLTKAGTPHKNADNLLTLQNDRLIVAQIAEKLLVKGGQMTSSDAVQLKQKVLHAQLSILSIEAEVFSHEDRLLSLGQTEPSASKNQYIGVPNSSGHSMNPGSLASDEKEVVPPGKQPDSAIELPIPLGASDKMSFEFLFGKFENQILNPMSRLVAKLNESGSTHHLSYLETFNQLEDRIHELQNTISDPTFVAPQRSYEAMNKELQELIRQAQAQYEALLNPEENKSVESRSTYKDETESLIQEEITAANNALDQAGVQLKAIGSALDKIQASSLSFTFSRTQKALMDKVIDLIADESNKNSIKYSLQHLHDASVQGDTIDGNRVQLRNKIKTLQDNLGALGSVLTQFMSEADRGLFVVSAEPFPVVSVSTTPGGREGGAPSTDFLARDTTEAKVVPASIEAKTQQSERISEELFALYKAGSHDAIWPVADQLAGKPEKRITQIINEINAALAKQGYTRETVTAFFKDKLHAIFSTILIAYREEKNADVRAQKLYESFDDLLKQVAAKLNTPPQAAPSSVETPIIESEVVSQSPQTDDIVAPDQVAIEAMVSSSEASVVVENSEAIQKRSEVISAKNRFSEELDHLTSEFQIVSGEAKGLQTIKTGGLHMIGYQVRIVDARFDNFIVREINSPNYVADANAVANLINDQTKVIVKIGDSLRESIRAHSVLTEAHQAGDVSRFTATEDNPAFTDTVPAQPEVAAVVESPAVTSPDQAYSVNDYLDRLVVRVDFNEEALYGQLPQTATEFDSKVEAIAAEYKRIQQDNGDTPEGDLVKGAIADCITASEIAVSKKVSPVPSFINLVNIAEPYIRKYREYVPSQTENANAIKTQRESYDRLDNEMISDDEKKLVSIRKQIENLLANKSATGEFIDPNIERILQSITTALATNESDPVVKSNIFQLRFKSIINEWEGIDGHSGLYFNTLTPEERLLAAGLPQIPEESKVRELEADSEYHQALKSYRAARRNFMGGTSNVNPDELTLDGSPYVYEDGLKTTYENKLQEFYANPGLLNKIKHSFGFKPKLTPELEEIRHKYNEARSAYAAALTDVLAARNAQHDRNVQFDPTDSRSKKAFGQKFVIDEFREQQRIQTEALGGKKNETVQKILSTLQKNKWALRGGSIIFAGAVAGGGLAALGVGAAALSATGAVIGSATAAARMAAVIGLGGAFGKAAHFKFEKGVTAAKKVAEDSETAALDNFSVATLHDLEESLLTAEDAKDSALRRQKVATVAAAIAPGGIFAAASVLDAITSLPSVESVLTERFQVDPAIPGRPAMVVEKVDLVGKGLDKEVIPSDEWLSLTASIKLKIVDLLATRPHLTEAEVGNLVLQKVQSEFGGRPWWGAANIDGIDVDIARQVPLPVEELAIDVDATSTPAPTPIPVQASSPLTGTADLPPPQASSAVETATPRYVVQNGDTLSAVALEKFGGSEIMKGLTLAEQKAAIYELMERAQNNDALRESIGLKSNDINKIYVGQDIALGGLEAELKAIVQAGDYKVPETYTRPSTGSLKVSVLDSETSLPINVAAKPGDIPADPAPIKPQSNSPVSARVAPRDEFVRVDYSAPRPYSPSGNYLETSDYRGFVTEVFGSIEKFNRAVQVEVARFERGTYDSLDRLMGTDVYLSPYKEFSHLTMAEIDAERARLDNMKYQYDTFGGQTTPNPFGEVGQMKYETYRASVERLDQLKEKFAWTPSTKLSDFIGRVVAETKAAELAEANTLLQA